MKQQCLSCGKPKLLFNSELEAKRFIKSRHNKANNVHLAPYYCTSCQAWHLTHKTHSH